MNFKNVNHAVVDLEDDIMQLELNYELDKSDSNIIALNIGRAKL